MESPQPEREALLPDAPQSKGGATLSLLILPWPAVLPGLPRSMQQGRQALLPAGCGEEKPAESRASTTSVWPSDTALAHGGLVQVSKGTFFSEKTPQRHSQEKKTTPNSGLGEGNTNHRCEKRAERKQSNCYHSSALPSLGTLQVPQACEAPDVITVP